MRFKISTLLLAATMIALMAFSPQQSNAQKVHLAGGLAVQNDVLVENLEVGQVFGKSTLSIVGMSNQVHNLNRTYATGIKFERIVYTDSRCNFSANGATLVNLSGTNNYLTFSPGVSVSYRVNNNIAFTTNLSSPITEGSQLFNPTNFQAGVNLVLTL